MSFSYWVSLVAFVASAVFASLAVSKLLSGDVGATCYIGGAVFQFGLGLAILFESIRMEINLTCSKD